MPLGAEDKETARCADLVRLGLDRFLILFVQRGKGATRFKNGFVVRDRAARGQCNEIFLDAHSAHLALGKVLRIAAEHNIGTAPRHVGGNGDSAEFTCLCDDLGFSLVVLRIQHNVCDAVLLQLGGELLALFDRDRTDQDRLPLFVAFEDLRNNRAILARAGLVDRIGIVDADHGAIGRHGDHIEVVNFAELSLLGERRTRHTRELGIETEVILEGDGGKRLGLLLDVDMLLGFNRLVQTVVVPSAGHETTGERIDDDDLAVLDDVVHIALHDAVGADRLVDMVRDGRVFGVGIIIEVEELLRLGNACGGQDDGLCLFVNDIVGVVGDLLGVLLVVGLLDDLLFQRAGKVVRQRIQLG